jgi:hypothetical protein
MLDMGEPNIDKDREEPQGQALLKIILKLQGQALFKII